MKSNSIIFVVSHPIQYFVPLYQKLTLNNNIQVRVLFGSDESITGAVDVEFGIPVKWDIPMLEGYSYKFLHNYSWRPSIHKGFFGLMNFGIAAELAKAPKSLVIIPGWNNLYYLMAFFFAKLFGHATAIRSDSPSFTENRRKNVKNGIRKFFLKQIFFKRIVDFCLYIGYQNHKFYKHFEVNDDRLIFAPFSVDNEAFRAIAEKRTVIRQELGFKSTDFIVLYVGKLLKHKRPFDLISAFLEMNVDSKKLLLVGEGQLRQDMEKAYSEYLGKSIFLTGFINQSRIGRYYAISDVLVLCSEKEPWGLVVNEGMNFGLPVIVYDSVGCADDLVIQGMNGFVVPKGDLGQLKSALEKVFASLEVDDRMCKASQSRIEEYSIEKTLEGFLIALDKV